MALSSTDYPNLGSAEQELFDAQWYSRKYCRGVGEAAAWQHFCSVGRRRGYRPNPFFDPAWYFQTYRACEPENALSHFVALGSMRGFWPSPLFEIDWYMQTYPDVAKGGINALEHFLGWGRYEARVPTSWCLDVENASFAKDLSLAADFDVEDIVGYFPHYSVSNKLISEPDAIGFFRPASPRWIFASPSTAKQPRLIDDAIVIGGRREILVEGKFDSSNLSISEGTTYRAFAVTYGISPILSDVIHLLGVDMHDALLFIDALWTRPDKVNMEEQVAARSVLVDSCISTMAAERLRRRQSAPVKLMSVARGAMFHAQRIRLSKFD